jgi:uncharacterized protein
MKKLCVVMMAVMFVAGMAGQAMAQYEIKVMTPVVKSALEGRKARFGELKALKAQGVLGENNRGYVTALSGGTAVEEIAASENTDRKAVYQAIIEQNSLGAGAMATVEKVFAGVQRERASAGDKVQDEQGEWITK